MIEFADFATEGFPQILCLAILRHDQGKTSDVPSHNANNLKVAEHPREDPHIVIVLEK